VAIVEAVEVMLALGEMSMIEPVTAIMAICKLVTTFNTTTITLSNPRSTYSGATRHSTTVNLCATRATAMHSRAATAAARPATAAHVGYERN
jgi:hypothetical protein